MVHFMFVQFLFVHLNRGFNSILSYIRIDFMLAKVYPINKRPILPIFSRISKNKSTDAVFDDRLLFKFNHLKPFMRSDCCLSILHLSLSLIRRRITNKLLGVQTFAICNKVAGDWIEFQSKICIRAFGVG